MGETYVTIVGFTNYIVNTQSRENSIGWLHANADKREAGGGSGVYYRTKKAT